MGSAGDITGWITLFFGLYGLAAGVGEYRKPGFWLNMVREVRASSALQFLTGLVTLAFGAVIYLANPFDPTDWLSILITVIGGWIVVEGLLILAAGGPTGNPPVRGRTSAGETTTADPLAQGLILTAIVITMGVAAFVLALTYRSYRLNTIDEVSNDPEDTRVSQLSGKESAEEIAERLDPDRTRDTDLPDELDALPGFEGSR